VADGSQIDVKHIFVMTSLLGLNELHCGKEAEGTEIRSLHQQYHVGLRNVQGGFQCRGDALRNPLNIS
jgi:hypothetical protein